MFNISFDIFKPEIHATKVKDLQYQAKWCLFLVVKKRNRTFARRLCLFSSFSGNESIFSCFYGMFCSIVQCVTASLLYCIVIAVISCSRNGKESHCPTELVMQPKLNLHLGCNVVSWIGNVITCNVEYTLYTRARWDIQFQNQDPLTWNWTGNLILKLVCFLQLFDLSAPSDVPGHF